MQYKHSTRGHGHDEIEPDIKMHSENVGNELKRSTGLHNKKIMNELIHESTSMETKMLQASKYYYFLSNLIFFPSVILNTFIGSVVLSINCYIGGGQTCIINGVVDTGCLEDNVDNLKLNQNTRLIMEYFIASLAFFNAILLGTQKAVRPSEKGETFQLMARRWGSFLRQMVTYKQTTTTSNISSSKVRKFVTTFNNLMENSPLLPQWLLRTRHKKNTSSGSKERLNSTADAIKASHHKSDVSLTPMRFTSFLTNVQPQGDMTTRRKPKKGPLIAIDHVPTFSAGMGGAVVLENYEEQDDHITSNGRFISDKDPPASTQFSDLFGSLKSQLQKTLWNGSRTQSVDDVRITIGTHDIDLKDLNQNKQEIIIMKRVQDMSIYQHTPHQTLGVKQEHKIPTSIPTAADVANDGLTTESSGKLRLRKSFSF